jgi:hypothetical protein
MQDSQLAPTSRAISRSKLQIGPLLDICTLASIALPPHFNNWSMRMQSTITLCTPTKMTSLTSDLNGHLSIFDVRLRPKYGVFLFYEAALQQQSDQNCISSNRSDSNTSSRQHKIHVTGGPRCQGSFPPEPFLGPHPRLQERFPDTVHITSNRAAPV